ncbi:MAG: squalene synthase HpnC [Pseudomonadota bacterium]
MSDQALSAPGPIETPSGKEAGTENFPVASLLISPALRPHVMCFYAFARAADDIADNPALSSDDKIRRLDLFEAGLDGIGSVAKALMLRDSLTETNVTDRHARDLLQAFRQDAVKQRYADWDELIGYCELSANPVGRYLMDLHGEDRALWPASDALCTVLQILNHIQDLKLDLLEMERVYLPLDMLAAEQLEVTALTEATMQAPLRQVLDRVLDLCDPMISAASTRAVQLRSRRLDAEMRVITALARRLSNRLRRQDPLAGRVKPSKLDFLRAALAGLPAFWRATPA